MYHIGCSGWFYWHWKGVFYPASLPQRTWFTHYTQHFRTVELNSPFYRFPKQSTAQNWYRQAPKGFVYTLKVNRMITHIKKFKGTDELIQTFYKLGDALKEKMGCFLFQLPPTLTFSEERMQEIVEQLDPEKKNVIEFRHQSWFRDEVYRELKKQGIIFCTVSSPSLPETIVKTARDVYVRFHGKGSWYVSKYTEKELQSWARKIKQAKARNVWAYFNNDRNAYAVKNARSLRNLLE